METDLGGIGKSFRDELIVLTLPLDEQRRLNGHFVSGGELLLDELLLDFHHSSDTFLFHFGDVLTPAQRAAVADINAIMDEMTKADFEGSNEEIVQRPVWLRLRERVREAIRVFECEGQTVSPYVKVQPGWWQRRS